MSQEKISVLYVDDEDINLFLFKASFGPKYQVITAQSGPEGLKKLQDEHENISVVISDMNMPQMNGIEFIEEARKNYQRIEYFILTGYDYNQEIDRALKSNVIQKFFTKPFVVEEIESAITTAVNK